METLSVEHLFLKEMFWALWFVLACIYTYVIILGLSALIYAINLAAINALKYFNATLFTSGVRWHFCTPLTLFPFLKQLFLRENTEQESV